MDITVKHKHKDIFRHQLWSCCWRSNDSGTVYETGVGWVGVTTYTDNAGNLRVKKEILCAMSGISTGNAPSYPNIVDAN